MMARHAKRSGWKHKTNVNRNRRRSKLRLRSRGVAVRRRLLLARTVERELDAVQREHLLA